MNYITLNTVDVDLVTITTAYLLVFYGDTGAGIFALSLGFLIDIFSAGPLGLFTLFYLAVFLGIKFGSLLFDLLSARGQIILVTLAVLLKEILFVIFLHVFSLEMACSYSNIFTFVSSALISGVSAPIVFHLFNYLNNALLKVLFGHSGDRE